MTKQKKAQRLAGALSNPMRWHELKDNECEEAAAELRRLDENEAALLDVLRRLLTDDDYWQAESDARALITRIEAERNEK